MKKVLYIIIAISVLVGLPMYLGLKERKEEKNKKAIYEASTLGRFNNWQKSLDVVILDVFEKDTIEVYSVTPLEECALAISKDNKRETLSFKYVGGRCYQLDISKSSLAEQGQQFDFIITKNKGVRSSFAMTRDEFIEEFPTLAPTLIFKHLNEYYPSSVLDQFK